MSKEPGRWWLPFLLFFLVVAATTVLGLLLWQVRIRETEAQILPGWSIIRPPHEVSALVVDGDIIWAGGRDGVWRVDKSGEGIPVELECDVNLSYVRALVVDGNGVLWIGHSSGLSYFNHGDCSTYHAADGLPGGQVFALYLDKEQRLWVGTKDGAAFNADGDWYTFDQADGLLVDSVNVILQDRLGGMWFGSYVAPNGGLSVCWQGDCQHFSIQNGLPHNNITSLLEDQDGNVWVGTGFSDHGGAARLVWVEDTWQIQEVLTSEDGLAGEKVRSIFQDRGGTLWFGSEFDGLALLDSGGWQVLTENDGLSNPEVKSMLQDSKGNLWIGTRDGLTRISAQGLDYLFSEK
jgi:ligand-binding sensor domain-containing protein